ncbi:MAG: dockerin type I domain-containing protein, partial [Candidatus Poribacteria bacterium]|nr:dockerin type I domain-containing protein [Candidatus Poribacteria bacterium]
IELTGHTDSVNAISISLDGNTVASASGPFFGDGEHSIFIWDAVSGEHRYTLSGHTGAIDVLAFSPDGEMLASGSQDSTVRLWHTTAGIQVLAFERHTEAITSLAFSADGGTLASGSMDGTIRLWNIDTAENEQTLSVDAIWPESVAFGFDEGTFAAGTYENTVELWDTSTGDRLAVLDGHRGSVNALAFNPINGMLASGSDDGTVLLWNITLDIEVAVLKGDVNQDGVVNILDLVLVATRLGNTGPNIADANGDGNVNILDLVLVAGEMSSAPAAPSIHSDGMAMFSPTEVKQWLEEARGLGLEGVTAQRGIRFLESLLAAFAPRETALLPNYPNPFNPETWIPYRLATDANAQISIYDSRGILVRQLDLGHQPAGHYINRGRAAYWDGRNEHAETVASGVYFYQLRTADYSHMRRMVVVK